MRRDRTWNWIVGSVALIAIALSGCGGGGSDSGSEKPAPPSSAPPSSGTEAPPPSAPPAAPVGDGTATISGSVSYEGRVPKLPPLKMDADPGCAKKHATAPASEVLVLGEGNTLGNVFVRVKSGLANPNYPAPTTPAVIDQDGCKYVPHVLGVMVGQEIRILNSDGLLHNVHALPKVNKTFNMAMPASRTEATATFDKEESMFKIKCDVHPWMGAWVQVMTHPFFAVTGEDGSFEIKNLPAGSYELEAWHEKLGTQSATVQVDDGGTATAEFKFAAPA